MSEERDTERDLEAPAEHTGNTLLSAGPAAAGHLERDPRVDELDRRVEQLEARIKVLELARGAIAGADRRWIFWVALLVALALGWQLRAFFI